MSTARHQQTEGQAEHTVKLAKRILRKYVNATGSDWDEHLPWAEYALNNSVSSVTGYTPFYLAYGFEPVEESWDRELQLGNKQNNLVSILTENLKRARDSIADAQEVQANYYDSRRRPVETYQEGDLVMLNAKGISWHTDSIRPPVFLPRWLGPFRIVPLKSEDGINWGGLNYRLKLPSSMSRIHPVFHAELLRRYHDPVEVFDGRPSKPRPPPMIDEKTGDKLFEVEAILGKRIRRKKIEYCVQWKSYGLEDADWVRYFPGDKSWSQDQQFIDAFEQRQLSDALNKVHARQTASARQKQPKTNAKGGVKDGTRESPRRSKRAVLVRTLDVNYIIQSDAVPTLDFLGSIQKVPGGLWHEVFV